MNYKNTTIILLSLIGIWLLPSVILAQSDEDPAFTSTKTRLLQDVGLELTASWGNTGIIENTAFTAPIGATSTLSWQSAYDTTNPSLASQFSALSNATYTLELYKGTIGSSTLVASQPLSGANAGVTASSSIPFSFDEAGSYILTYVATYPDGVYPTDTAPCRGDICLRPEYSLSEFEKFMTTGQDDPPPLGTPYLPATLGMISFTVNSPGNSNVLFLPGTMESRLYMRKANGDEERLWEPLSDGQIPLLGMTADGASDYEIYTRDIIDHLYSDNPFLSAAAKLALGDSSVLYGPFEDFMDSLVADNTIKEWRAFPYDWRYDVNDIIEHGTLVGNATGAPTRVYLQDVAQELASSSPTGKVTIVAHSNGGLLAKALAIDLANKGESGLLDQIIIVGTPQLGTPSAIGSLLHGDGQTRLLGIISYSGTVRATGITMRGPYDLLPSTSYFSQVKTPVITFSKDPTLAPYVSSLGSAITSFKNLLDFLIDTNGLRAQPTSKDLATPAVALYSLTENAKDIHDSIDTWTPPADIPLTSIVGWGQNTVSSYQYSSPGKNLTNCDHSFPFPLCDVSITFKRKITTTQDGDGEVVSPSAAGTTGQVLYFDTQEYSKDKNPNITHQSLLSAIPILDELRDLFTGKKSTIEPYIGTTKPVGGKNPLIVIHSSGSANISVSDAKGNQTGVVTVATTSDLYFTTQGIPGSSVQTVGGENYITIPDDGTNYSVTATGYETGTTTISVGTSSSVPISSSGSGSGSGGSDSGGGSESTDSETGTGGSVSTVNQSAPTQQEFAPIPVTASTTATFTTSGTSDAAGATDGQTSSLTVDTGANNANDGSGNSDSTTGTTETTSTTYTVLPTTVDTDADDTDTFTETNQDTENGGGGSPVQTNSLTQIPGGDSADPNSMGTVLGTSTASTGLATSTLDKLRWELYVDLLRLEYYLLLELLHVEKP